MCTLLFHSLYFLICLFPTWLIPSPCIYSSVFPHPHKSGIPLLSFSLTSFTMSPLIPLLPMCTLMAPNLLWAGFAVFFFLCIQLSPPSWVQCPYSRTVCAPFRLKLHFLPSFFLFHYFNNSRNSLSLIQSVHSNNPLVHKIQDWLSMRHKSVRFC